MEGGGAAEESKGDAASQARADKERRKKEREEQRRAKEERRAEREDRRREKEERKAAKEQRRAEREQRRADREERRQGEEAKTGQTSTRGAPDSTPRGTGLQSLLPEGGDPGATPGDADDGEQPNEDQQP